jgi:hypothetical protein
MPKPSGGLDATIRKFLSNLEELVERESRRRISVAMGGLRPLFGGGPIAEVAPAPRRGPGRPPRAGRPRSAAASSADEAFCRYPGCPNRHSGPRYHKFCRDHFAKLSAAEREKYKAQWKAAHGG